MIKTITSRENAKIKYAFSLKTSKGRKDHQQFLCESKNSLEVALKSQLVTDIFTLKEMENIPSHINQYLVTEEIIEKIAFSAHPEGIVFIANFLPMKKPFALHRAVYFDGISDPGNMGTMIRTALAFDYDAIILSSTCVSIYNEKVIAASKGAIFLLPIYEDSIESYKGKMTIVASTLSSQSVSLEETKITSPFILVFGNESHGISEEVKKTTDIFVKIPINHIDSLNVSVASGILMHHFK